MLAALDLARRIEAGELTPRAVVELCAEAIAADEAKIGAFVSLDLEAAARAAEDPRLAATPLRGLPVGVKDIFDTADLPTQYGSPIYAGYRPRADAAAVAMVRRAGGLILGKTVTTEFAWMVPAGTRNPRNPAHTPGGSSSGSAAAVAAAMLPIALGSQTAGSVDPAGGVLRRRRVQAVVPADPDRRHEMLFVAARYRGSVRCRCRRCRLRGGGDHRPRFARRPRRTGGAAHRTSPHASVAAGERGDARARSKPPPAPRKPPVRR